MRYGKWMAFCLLPVLASCSSYFTCKDGPRISYKVQSAKGKPRASIAPEAELSPLGVTLSVRSPQGYKVIDAQESETTVFEGAPEVEKRESLFFPSTPIGGMEQFYYFFDKDAPLGSITEIKGKLRLFLKKEGKEKEIVLTPPLLRTHELCVEGFRVTLKFKQVKRREDAWFELQLSTPVPIAAIRLLQGKEFLEMTQLRTTSPAAYQESGHVITDGLYEYRFAARPQDAAEGATLQLRLFSGAVYAQDLPFSVKIRQEEESPAE